jgi:DNA-binding transcriptional regulator GbsR (MarR family)
MKKKGIPEIEHLSELVGEFIEYWGFKKIHGKIWLHIYLSDTPLDAKALMERLHISKALVSISLKDLLIYDVILEGPLSDSGTRTYLPNRDISKVIQQVLRGREKVMMGKIKGAFQNLKDIPEKDSKDQHIRAQSFKELEKLISKGDKLLNTVMALI